MPNGFTTGIYDGTVTTAREYIIGVAKSWTPLLHMRESDLRAELVRASSDASRYEEKLKQIHVEIDQISNLTDDEIRVKITEEVNKRSEEKATLIKKNEELKSRYDSMLKKVVNWPVPEKLAKFKESAIDCLLRSMEFDIYSDDIINSVFPTEAEILTPDEWRTKELERLNKDLLYYTTQLNHELERTERANEWIDALIENLPQD